MANFVLGMNCKLYYCTTLLDGGSNTPATLSWLEMDNIQDLNQNLETGEADISTRANSGWEATAATLKNGAIEFEALWKPSDTAFEAFKDAWLNATEIAVMALDGSKATSGNQGLASNFSVTNFSRSEPLKEAVKVSVTLKPSSYSEWYKVT